MGTEGSGSGAFCAKRLLPFFGDSSTFLGGLFQSGLTLMRIGSVRAPSDGLTAAVFDRRPEVALAATGFPLTGAEAATAGTFNEAMLDPLDFADFEATEGDTFAATVLAGLLLATTRPGSIAITFDEDLPSATMRFCPGFALA
ncbi:MAG: hypothetical protein JO353_03340 [Phycisphaerae bacterium]|nr:hypothetical protein [Phycisphaerae bacterium]